MKKYKPGLTVDDGDVEYVLHEADVSHTGTLSKDEVLPAIAVSTSCSVGVGLSVSSAAAVIT